MSEILGYTRDNKPIHPNKPGMVTTACVISCVNCGFYIRGMGGPMRGAKCVPCYEKEQRWAKAPVDATHWGPNTPTEYGMEWIEAFYQDLGNGQWTICGGRFDKGNPTVHGDWPKRMATLEPRP